VELAKLNVVIVELCKILVLKQSKCLEILNLNSPDLKAKEKVPHDILPDVKLLVLKICQQKIPPQHSICARVR
jgi:hypothetical protein